VDVVTPGELHLWLCVRQATEGCWFVSNNCSVLRVTGAAGRHLQDTFKEPIILRA